MKKVHHLPFRWCVCRCHGAAGNQWRLADLWRRKNGKTWFALKLAQYLSGFEKTLYVSAEEGTGKGFVDACRRAGIDSGCRKLQFLEYIPINDLTEKLGKRGAPKVVILDNLTIYNDELKYGAFQSLLRTHDDTLFVFLAHEEKGQPYTASAKMCRKLAKIIAHVQGLTAHISGRCPGGKIIIDETKSALYWGNNENFSTND